MNKRHFVSINLSEDELKRVEEARSYGVLNSSSFLKVLIKNGVDELEKTPNLVFIFDKDKRFEKVSEKTKVISIDSLYYEFMEKVCECTPFSMSSLAKYFIMPQVDEILERKEWNYKP